MPTQDNRGSNPPLDEVYRRPREQIVDFAFDESVAEVFQDMIRRSVPGYETVVACTGLIAARHLPVGGTCYDLGCSLGASSHAVLRAVGERDCRVVAIDGSEAMIERAQGVGWGGEPYRMAGGGHPPGSNALGTRGDAEFRAAVPAS